MADEEQASMLRLCLAQLSGSTLVGSAAGSVCAGNIPGRAGRAGRASWVLEKPQPYVPRVVVQDAWGPFCTKERAPGGASLWIAAKPG